MVPTGAPFYLDSLTISIIATAKSVSSVPLGVSTPLVLGVDFFPGYQFIQATAEQEQPVYGAICFTDTSLAGTITCSYTQLGNGYTATVGQLGLLNSGTIDPLTTSWEDAVGGLADYPITEVNYNETVPSYLSSITTAITQLSTSLQGLSSQPSVFNFNNHIGDTTGNPHGVTAMKLGVGSVPNWSVAMAADVISGINPRLFVTPSAVANSVNSVIPQATGLNYGKAMLNLGLTQADSVDNSKALTAGGLVSMLNNGQLVAFNNLQNNQRQAVQVTPNPIVYPALYNNVVCWNFYDILLAVQTQTGISPLTYNPRTGVIWFPHSVTAPVITLTYPSSLNTLSHVGQSL